PGLEVMTRGTAVIEGLVTSWRTRAALEELGLSADGHRSHQLVAADLDRADLVLAMATEHVRYVRRVHARAAARPAPPKPLAPDLSPADGDLAARLAALRLDAAELGVWEDIEDPVSGEVEQFHRCAAEIGALLEQVVGVLGPALAFPCEPKVVPAP